ncbi:MAG TPA: isocitrate lyase/phosphoenolpyruvate mutase family protein [Candidatus Acidoferrales bacterium]|nr:isocitrate lyase/phosphoenolpyruvate mutase family protein [Candidatus Acidoferrales bacterium]
MAFRALHERKSAFIIPNPWDIGSARILERLGFEALATTSLGFALSIGRSDGDVDRDAMLAHVAQLAAATDLPVSADLENGYADEPGGVAETVRLAAAAGLAGCSIEDLPLGRQGEPYDLEFAAKRVRAAVDAARSLPFPFTLTARAENLIAGRPDLDDTIARLQAYQDAGADVLYAPGLRTEDEIAAVVRAVDRPVNVLASTLGTALDLAALERLGVRRVSVGGALARLAYDTMTQTAAEMREGGTFSFAR